MNSSRRILKQQDDKKAKKRKKAQKSGGTGPKLFIPSIIIIVILVVLAVGYEQLHPRLVLTVDKQKLYLSDLMYDVQSIEKSYNSLDELYKSSYGKSFWDLEVEEGVTGSESTKDSIIEIATQREVLYHKALGEGYSLTDEEKETIKKDVEEIRKGMNFKQKMIVGLSAKRLTKAKEKETIAARYKEDMITGFGIDYDKIKEGISEADNRQYDVQYYSVSYKKSETGDDGNPVYVSDEEKAKLKKELEDLRNKALTEEDFAKLIGEDEKTNVKFNGEDTNFIETDETFLSADVRNKVKAMDNDAISEVLEDENGCYVVKMINNNSKESYEKAIEDANKAEENTKFNEAYTKIKDEIFIELNDSEWDKVKLGSLTS